MSYFDCSWKEFKQRAKEFHEAIPSLDYEGLENGYKALGLSYLGMKEELWQHSAAIVLKLMMEEMIDRQIQLDSWNWSKPNE
jgi:hypothetical protein